MWISDDDDNDDGGNVDDASGDFYRRLVFKDTDLKKGRWLRESKCWKEWELLCSYNLSPKNSVIDTLIAL